MKTIYTFSTDSNLSEYPYSDKFESGYNFDESFLLNLCGGRKLIISFFCFYKKNSKIYESYQWHCVSIEVGEQWDGYMLTFLKILQM